jgi:hypothetical protein
MVLRSRRRTIAPALAAVLSVAAAALAACSDGDDRDKLLSQASAVQLRASLDAVEENVDAGNCQGAANQAATLRQQVDALPNRISRKLRRVLADGADRLETLISTDCEPAGATGTTAPPTEEVPEEEKPDKGKGKAKGKDKKEGETTTPENPPEGTTDEGDLEDGDGQSDGGVEITPDEGTTP